MRSPFFLVVLSLELVSSFLLCGLTSPPALAIMPGGGDGGGTYRPRYVVPIRNPDPEWRRQQEIRIIQEQEAERWRQRQRDEAAARAQAEAAQLAADAQPPKEKEEAPAAPPVKSVDEQLHELPEWFKGLAAYDPDPRAMRLSDYLTELTDEFLRLEQARAEKKTAQTPSLWNAPARLLNTAYTYVAGTEGPAGEPSLAEVLTPAACPICFEDFGPATNAEAGSTSEPIQACTLECKHTVCSGCLSEGLQVAFNAGKADFRCPMTDCKHSLSPREVSQLIRTPEELLRLQRFLIHSLPGYKVCPRCSSGVAKFNEHMEFFYQCSACKNDLCFDCGKPPHHGNTCYLMSDEGSKRAFIQHLIDSGQSSQYGLCPHCNILVSRLEGCNFMKCGQNAPDKAQIAKGVVSDRGCGRNYKWENAEPGWPVRIRLETAFPELGQPQNEHGAASAVATTNPRADWNPIRQQAENNQGRYEQLRGAIQRGDFQAVWDQLQFIERGSLFGGMGLLRFAGRNEAVLRVLLDHGVNPNQLDGYPTPYLNEAARAGHAQVVRTLLEYHANPNLADVNWNLSALGAVMDNIRSGIVPASYPEIVRRLLAAGANANGTLAGVRDLSYLDIAAARGQWYIASLLLDAGANPRTFRRGGWTMAHWIKVKVMKKMGRFPLHEH